MLELKNVDFKVSGIDRSILSNLNLTIYPGDFVVIIGGNHDSPSFLDAPKELLKQLKVYIVGAVTIDPADEVSICCATDW